MFLGTVVVLPGWTGLDTTWISFTRSLGELFISNFDFINLSLVIEDHTLHGGQNDTNYVETWPDQAARGSMYVLSRRGFDIFPPIIAT